MSHLNKIHGLVIPGDSPPKVSSLKRQVLFFDSISLVHPDDRAVINDCELTEKFPGMEIKRSEYASYPRSDNYEEEFRNIIDDTRTIQNRGIIRISHPRVFSSDDAGANFMLYNSVISDKNLILSAVPDLTNEQPTIKLPNGYVSGGGVSQGGYKSRYSLDVKPPYVIKNANDAWNALASLRTGRAIKALRRAHMERCCPLALDNVNSNIIEVIASQNAEEVYKDSDYMAGMSISLDIVDPLELENALENLSWDDVISIRKELFPKVSELRHYIIDQVERLNKRKISNYDQIREETEKLREDFLNKQEVLAEAWEKLRIASVLKLGGSVGAGNLGLILLPASGSWSELLIRAASIGLIAASSLTPELKSLIPAKRKVKKHPLFFISKLNKL